MRINAQSAGLPGSNAEIMPDHSIKIAILMLMVAIVIPRQVVRPDAPKPQCDDRCRTTGL